MDLRRITKNKLADDPIEHGQDLKIEGLTPQLPIRAQAASISWDSELFVLRSRSNHFIFYRYLRYFRGVVFA